MPLVKIDMIRGVRTPEEIKKLADVVQEVMLDKFAAPARDRYQVITQHEPYELIFEDTGLSIPKPTRTTLRHPSSRTSLSQNLTLDPSQIFHTFAPQRITAIPLICFFIPIGGFAGE
ncbi:hypothetical protein D6C85_03686 [Aureobasidium pullulans]|uniref:4-oxalocrotonate tautomerase-like domain-containing protein n=1 Tax=Aureobasidium pullulans TaxID=5580 RepID=A0A4S9X874_AURPU|nr:hypothetical protein D6C85_03686 [Aureobasidium pullulans]